MSWIDADVLIKDLRADIDVYRGRGSYVYTDGIMHGLDVAIREVQRAAKKNEPLTLEELDKMDGQPVWITPGGFWALVHAREGQRTTLVSNDREAVYADSEIALVGPVYRCPPERRIT